ncbi:hypothetical protein GOODEAATRI_030321 [Goodea atripinnis]|uniref:Uncharacterized protein n=1 Tax=Goodea atripinnis TaxID=208336 RepID=A0ABV0PIB5_9TELE
MPLHHFLTRMQRLSSFCKVDHEASWTQLVFVLLWILHEWMNSYSLFKDIPSNDFSVKQYGSYFLVWSLFLFVFPPVIQTWTSSVFLTQFQSTSCPFSE